MTVTIPLLVGALTIVGTWFISLSTGKKRTTPADRLRSIIIPAYTSHARHLPKPSRHAFSYPLLYLGVDVDALEQGELDLPGRLLGYGGQPWTKCLGLRTDGYLRPGLESLRQKAEHLLTEQGLGKVDMAHIWLVTMPSFVGFEGINPLSVWYIYSEKREMTCVILEVHNTFGEKHAYVLKHDSQHLVGTAEGYHHSWTFPRSFHVSPFNSRNGYYRLDIIDPFVSSASDTIPEIKVFLRLLTPSKECKLQALLATSPSRPSIDLDPARCLEILGILLRYPLSLLLTTPRIMYQAYRLHYEKRLAVYPRPEPSSEAAKEAWNAPQDDVEGLGLPIAWQSPGWSERTARRIVETFCRSRVSQTGTGLHVDFLDQREDLMMSTQESSSKQQVCSIKTADPKFFAHLITAPSPRHFAVLSPERLTTIEDPEMFIRLMESPSNTTPELCMIERMTTKIRQRFFLFFMAHSALPATPDLFPFDNMHFITTSSFADQLRILAIVYLAYIADVAEERIMDILGATFVEGREPWKLWERALKRQWVDEAESSESDDWTVVEKNDLGSIRLA